LPYLAEEDRVASHSRRIEENTRKYVLSCPNMTPIILDRTHIKGIVEGQLFSEKTVRFGG